MISIVHQFFIIIDDQYTPLIIDDLSIIGKINDDNILQHIIVILADQHWSSMIIDLYFLKNYDQCWSNMINMSSVDHRESNIINTVYGDQYTDTVIDESSMINIDFEKKLLNAYAGDRLYYYQHFSWSWEREQLYSC